MVCPKTVDTQKRGNFNAGPLDLQVAYSWIGAHFSELGGDLSGGIPVMIPVTLKQPTSFAVVLVAKAINDWDVFHLPGITPQ
jgi:hypothetical protein